jgi:hypothetical protein
MMNECAIATLPNNTLVMNARNYVGQADFTVKRAIMWSHDEGDSCEWHLDRHVQKQPLRFVCAAMSHWLQSRVLLAPRVIGIGPYLNPDLPDPVVQGSMVAGDHTPASLGVGEPLFFTNAHTELDRANDTLMMSTSGGLHWEEVFQIQHGCSEYTGLVQFKDGRIGAGFDDGGPFPSNYQPMRAQCKVPATNETFVLLELSRRNTGDDDGPS